MPLRSALVWLGFIAADVVAAVVASAMGITFYLTGRYGSSEVDPLWQLIPLALATAFFLKQKTWGVVVLLMLTVFLSYSLIFKMIVSQLEARSAGARVLFIVISAAGTIYGYTLRDYLDDI